MFLYGKEKIPESNGFYSLMGFLRPYHRSNLRYDSSKSEEKGEIGTV